MTFFITTLTLLSNIVFVGFILLFFFDKKVKALSFKYVEKYIVHILFVISLGAVVFSLVYSNVVGFPPCELCWIQRIFIYPQAILALVALTKKDKGIVTYLLPLSIIGGLIALFHSLTNWGIGSSFLSCTATGGACARVYVMEYGYITIPFMALSSFVYLIVVSLIYYKAKNGRE